MSPGGENILSPRLEYSLPRREYSLPPRVESLPSIDREKVSPHDKNYVFK